MYVFRQTSSSCHSLALGGKERGHVLYAGLCIQITTVVLGTREVTFTDATSADFYLNYFNEDSQTDEGSQVKTFAKNN